MKLSKKRKGTAFIVSMIFVLVFSALAVSMAALSGTNMQIAQNQRKADAARACAESGLEVIRHWLSYASIPGDTPPSQRFYLMANSFQSAVSSISNITPYVGASNINIPSVTLNLANGQSFSAQITQIDLETLRVNVTGVCGELTKTISVNFVFGTKAHTVFDFGVATKGPLSLSGNVELGGANVSVESSVYIESENSLLALSLGGNSQIAGDVTITNPLATVNLLGEQASIGGETGQDAIDNHVSFGAPPAEFPPPNPGYFEHYVVNIVDPSTDTSTDATFENVRIVAGTNPTFSGNVTLNGIIFIETPNVVTFTGGTTITGIIVGDGDLADDSATNQISFQGGVQSFPVTELPAEEQFNGLKNETGTFVLAPGFHLSFGSNFNALSGAIAGNGIEFSGNAGGTINGTIINYSDEQMTLSGNSDLYFNRSGTTQVPAGFVPEIVLRYVQDSYSETVL